MTLSTRRGSTTICLTMIVKDEAHVVGETIASVLPYISEFVVVDTGSSDGTPRLMREYFERHELPGYVFQRPWRDFGHNRTEALQLARAHATAQYLWMVDADDLLVGEPQLSDLRLDGYELRFGPDVEYWRPQIFKRSMPWRYAGTLHEYATCDAAISGRIEGSYSMRSRRLGSRNRRPDKYTRDAELLAAQVKADPGNPRSVFYLAQSHFDAGDFEPARRFYAQRAAMGGWDEEVFYARFRLAQCRERLECPVGEIIGAYTRCFDAHPTRAEPLVNAARVARLAGDFPTAYEYARRAADVPHPGPNALFVHTGVYEYGARDELAIAAYYLGRHDEAFRLNQSLLENPALPESERPRIEGNRDFSVPFTLDAYLQYDAALVRRLCSRVSRKPPHVTLSITTCKRLDLFVRTMTSFLNACEDIDLIDRWICVDDNSGDADRIEMRRLFPFFEFRFKGPEEKGHAHSMNLIRCLATSPFLLHLEDDWQFFVRRRYIEPAIEILQESPNVGQVLFNRNYAEVLQQRELPGGHLAFSWEHGYRFRVHEHYAPRSDDYRRFQAAHGWRASNAWWPHYSLRPAVLKQSVLEKIGAYAEDSDHFELEYAQRYTAAGYRSAFLDGIHCLHIGRLTSERDDSTKVNAYQLNEQRQFARQDAPAARARTSPAVSSTSGLTLVTGYLDLSRFEERPAGKTWEDYRRHAAWLLAQPAALVVFADRERIGALRQLRPASLPTHWAPFDREDLTTWPLRTEVEDCIARHGWPEYAWVDKDTPLYLMTVWEKTEWLRRALDLNPFGSTHFAWIDFGIHWLVDAHAETLFDEAMARLPAAPPPEHIRICAMSHIERAAFASRSLYYAKHRWPVAAGVFAGPEGDLRWLADAFRTERSRCVTEGFATNEEMILGHLLHRHADRFETFYGDHQSVLLNYAGARSGHPFILGAAAESAADGDREGTARRLEAIRPHLDDGSRERWQELANRLSAFPA